MLLSLHPNIIVHVKIVVSLFSSPPLAHKKYESVAAINFDRILVNCFSGVISANLWQLRRSNSQVFGQNLWPPHFCTFCELVEGEENKLTTIFHMDYNVRV